MDPSTFRSDPYLRSSAYHLATWSLAALVVELRLNAPSSVSAQGSSVLAVGMAVVAGALLTSMTQERRVGKIAGVAGEPVYAAAGRLWTLSLATLGAAGVVAVHAGWPTVPFNLLVAGVGGTLAWWGRKVGMGWYVGLGAGLVALAVLEAEMAMAQGQASLGFRFLVLGVLVPGAAWMTNRRYLWDWGASSGDEARSDL